MTKAELVEKVSEKVDGLTKKQTEIIINTIFDSVKDALAKGDKIEIRGFGSFKIRSRKQREGRNPKTGSPVSVPAKKVPFFKAGKELKELVDSQ
jgi:integration host factor subunit beta